jgi:hypothetical protein
LAISGQLNWCAKVYLHDTDDLVLVDSFKEEYKSWVDEDGELGEENKKRLKQKFKPRLWYLFAFAASCFFRVTNVLICTRVFVFSVSDRWRTHGHPLLSTEAACFGHEDPTIDNNSIIVGACLERTGVHRNSQPTQPRIGYNGQAGSCVYEPAPRKATSLRNGHRCYRA